MNADLLAALNSDTIYLAILDALSDRDTRNDIEDALADGDAVEATHILLNAINRFATTPQPPAPVADPLRAGGTAAGVPLDTLVALAGETP